jgi:hypothetical protein
MLAIYQWLPLVYTLAAPLLAWLLVLGRRSPRRTTRLVALAAALAVLLQLTAVAVDLWPSRSIAQNTTLLGLLALASYGTTLVAGALGTAAWVLLLADAAGDGRGRRRLVFLTLVFAVALALGIALSLREPLLDSLRDTLMGLREWGALLLTALQDVAVLAAVVIAFAFPATAGPMSPSGTAGTSEPTPPVVP